LERKRALVVAPFDRRSAFECALLDKAALGAGDKRGGRKEHWQRIKVDRQIVAVAKANNASILITDDGGLRSTALAVGLLVYGVSELELPDGAKQGKLDFKSAAPTLQLVPASETAPSKGSAASAQTEVRDLGDGSAV
jgi:hypothetical protein